MSDWRIDVIEGAEGWQALADPAAALFERAEEPNIFFHPAWIGAWLETLGRTNDMATAVAWQGDRLRALWPFFENVGIGGVGLWPVGAQTADWFDPLCECPEADAPLLAECAKALTRKYVFVWLPLVRERMAQALLPELRAQRLKPIVRKREDRLMAEAPPTGGFDAFLANAFSKKHRYNLRRAEKALAQKGALTHPVYDDPESVKACFDEIVSVEDASWKGRKRAGLFSSLGQRRMYRKLLPALAAEGRAEIAALAIDGKAIAYQILLKNGKWRGLHNTAYLPDWGEHSPGSALIAHSMRRAFEEGAMFDFMQGGFDYKARLSGKSEPLTDIFLAPATLGGMANRLALRLFEKRSRAQP